MRRASKGSLAPALLAALLVRGAPALAQSSFDTDPFSSRFRERANLDLKFKEPEKGGVVRVEIAGEGGRQSLVSENVWLAEAAPGGTVKVLYQDIRLSARRVRADYARKTVVAEGDVVFEQGPSHLTGSRLDLDLAEKIGVLTDGAVDLAGGVHLRGATLAKVGPRSFTIADGTLTACEGEKPAWIFHVKSGRVTIDDYARLKGVTFRLFGAPLLYTPYLLWPALRDRASGFLIPGVGYNTRRGGYLGLSYYQVLGRSADATFSTDVYSKRFLGFGLEGRVRPSEGTRAEATYYIIRDPESDGAWRWQTRGSLVSDDLGDGVRGVVSWLDFSDQNFFQEFNRDFNLTSTRSVKDEAFVTMNRGPFSYNARLDREEALFGTSTVITERRPVLEARFRPTPVLGQFLFLEASAQAGELRAARPFGQPSGLYDRVDFFPKASAPLSPVPWLSIDASLGERVTSYGKSLSADGSALDGSRYTRSLLVAGVEMTGPSFARLFEAKIGSYTKFKHVIEPRIDWDYTSDPGTLQRAPLLDEVDSIASAHTLRYALVQRLLAKGKSGAAREIASLEISRVYSFRLPGEGTFAGPSPLLHKNGPVDAALRVNTGSVLNFDARTTWDTSANQITSASLTASFSAAERAVSLSLFDSRPVGATASAQLRYSVGAPIVKKLLRLDVIGNYDLSEGRMLESRTLLTIEGSCFKILTEYRDLRIGATPSRDFRIALNLKNVGSFLDFTGSLSH